ncbi:hypothetical protein AYO44_13345 [Planctomycetaceae bacterium SCGC AG-212-F19]|nr:hypothetical protein AYO44_13345 [Planctomycetaceae bacterium SCGC AG-212-F19]
MAQQLPPTQITNLPPVPQSTIQPSKVKRGIMSFYSTIANIVSRLRGQTDNTTPSPQAEAPLPSAAQAVTERLLSGNAGHGHKIDADDVLEFLTGDAGVVVNSSNVDAVKYDPTKNELTVTFLKKGSAGGGVYVYSDISEEEALSFIRSGSKGRWVWDHLRQRGSSTAHKKRYRRIG